MQNGGSASTQPGTPAPVLRLEFWHLVLSAAGAVNVKFGCSDGPVSDDALNEYPVDHLGLRAAIGVAPEAHRGLDLRAVFRCRVVAETGLVRRRIVALTYLSGAC